MYARSSTKKHLFRFDPAKSMAVIGNSYFWLVESLKEIILNPSDSLIFTRSYMEIPGSFLIQQKHG